MSATQPIIFLLITFLLFEKNTYINVHPTGGFSYVDPGIFDDRRRLRNLLDDDVVQQVEALEPESANDDLLVADRGLLGGRVGYDFSQGRTGGLVVTGKDRKRGYFRRG